MNGLTNILLKFGPGRIFALLGVAAIAAAAVFALLLQVGGEDKALLFSDIDMREASTVTAKLDQANIPYELRGDGSAIYVPRSKVLATRMMLSGQGLPSRGSIGYEIFDKTDALGATQFMQNINRLRALEGELARTIASLDNVGGARVHLVLPERQLFERDAQQPTASIVVKLTRDALQSGEVRAIRNLVASAVPGLSASRVTILDETGRLLASAEDGGDDSIGAAAAERQSAVEDRIRRTVKDIVEGVVGPGAARVQVSAELDLNRVTQNSETFDPESKVVRSTQSVDESQTSTDATLKGATSSANNIPGTPGAGTEGAEGAKSGSTRTEETVNYEISKTTKTEIIEGGRIRKLSVAVAVDGITNPGEKGAPPKWSARDPTEIARLTALVRSAVGYDESRGDKVEVVNVRFARADVGGPLVEKPKLLSFQSNDIMRGSEIGAALIAALAIVFFVLRPLIAGLLTGAGGGGAGEPLLSAAAVTGAGGNAQLPPSPPVAAALPGPEGEPAIDIARIHGQVKASSVRQVAEVVEQHPDESAAILRGWLNNAI